jgi:hypothetical protein
MERVQERRPRIFRLGVESLLDDLDSFLNNPKGHQDTLWFTGGAGSSHHQLNGVRINLSELSGLPRVIKSWCQQSDPIRQDVTNLRRPDDLPRVSQQSQELPKPLGRPLGIQSDERKVPD